MIRACDVLQWPEYKAFAARLGIPQVPTSDIVIALPVKGVARVYQDWLPDDCAAKTGRAILADDPIGIRHPFSQINLGQ